MTQLRLGLEPSLTSASCNVGSTLTFFSPLDVDDCDDCVVAVRYDAAVFESANESDQLSLGKGPHRRNIRWGLRALKPATGSVIQVRAVANGAVQLAQFTAEVHGHEDDG